MEVANTTQEITSRLTARALIAGVRVDKRPARVQS
jgi:hypothetical protein